MDVSSLYTNVPQEEGTEIVSKAYETFHNYNTLPKGNAWSHSERDLVPVQLA